MKLIYGTGNNGKIKQVKDYLNTIDLELEIISIKDLGFNEEIEENGKTFEENSLIKAKAIKEFCNKNAIKGIIITDDSGICVEELDGRPGVLSARYAGEHATQEEILNKLLKEMKEVEEKTGIVNRNAKFVCVLTAILPNNKIIVAKGETIGRVAEKIGKIGKLTYDPVFIPQEFNKTMSELDDKDLGKTHREKALLDLFEKLKLEGFY